ncbi:MAG: glycosyltransferase [Bacillota bacterium]|nr:glycosyltransferase [Bacillota bacterium]
MIKVLIGSSVRQDSRTLEYFLDSLRDLLTNGWKVDYMFVDDNDDEKSSQVLKDFRPLDSRVTLIKDKSKRAPYVKDHITHRWNEKLVQRVAKNKNLIMEHCKAGQYDYLLLVDSDLLLHPETLKRLIATGKDIVSEVFWTQFQADSRELPNVWLMDAYQLCRTEREEQISQEEAQRRTQEFLTMLRSPGVYKVGGLGACTLFTRQALEKGVSYDEIYNLSFVGEDRHLCIRAAALGFELFADTYYPCFHIYREKYLEQVPDYLHSLRKMKFNTSMQVINGILKETIENLRTVDFRREMEEERFWHNFTAQGWRAFQSFVNKQELTSTKSILRAELVIKDLDFNENLDRCEILLEVKLRGTSGGQVVNRGEEIRIKMLDTGAWKIDEYEMIKEYEDHTEAKYCTSIFNSYTRQIKNSPGKLSLGMLVHNEADRYLRRVLEHAAQYVDEAVILDDASTDDTVSVCMDCLKDISHFIHTNSKNTFSNEVILRKQLWNLLIERNPDWILILDADEIFEDRAVNRIRELLNIPYVDYYMFRTYDFWDLDHYREDEHWNGHLRHMPCLLRYQPHFSYQWREIPLHCGRFPINLGLLPGALSDLRLKHLGWASESYRKQKYKRYMEADGEGKYGSLEQYQTILDSYPVLKPWIEDE